MRTLAINEDGLERLRTEHQLVLDKDLAARIGMDKSTVSRVLKGNSAPGPSFVAGILIAFPVKFEDIFDVVIENEPATAAAPPQPLQDVA